MCPYFGELPVTTLGVRNYSGERERRGIQVSDGFGGLKLENVLFDVLCPSQALINASRAIKKLPT